MFALYDIVVDVQGSAVDPNPHLKQKTSTSRYMQEVPASFQNSLETLVAVHPKPAAGVRSRLVTTLTTSRDFNKAIHGFHNRFR